MYFVTRQSRLYVTSMTDKSLLTMRMHERKQELFARFMMKT